MKQIPEIQAERYRLLARLEDQTLGIKREMAAIKSSLQPLQLLKSVLEQATESIQDTGLATQVTKLALRAMPNKLTRHPITALILRMAMPWIVQKAEDLSRIICSEKGVISWVGVRETIRDTIAGVRRAFKQT